MPNPLRQLKHAAFRQFPLLTWKLWHLKNRFSPDNEFEVDFIDNLNSFVKCENRTAIDIGANFGVYTLAFCRRFRSVHAVEPIPSLGTQLRDGGPRNCTVHPVALGAEPGKIDLCIPHTAAKGAIFSFATTDSIRLQEQEGSYSSVDRIPVTLATFDEEFANVKDLDCLKIDVEGSEMGVLMGAKKMLQSQDPIIIVEVEKECNPNGARIFELLQGWGYIPHYYRSRRLVQTDAEILDRMDSLLKTRENDPAFVRYRNQEYIYNYIFFSKNRRLQAP